MKINWKTAFWTCLLLWLFTIGLAGYTTIDQSYTITYTREGYKGMERDIQRLSVLLERSGISKTRVEQALKDHPLTPSGNDTIPLETLDLIFRNGELVKVRGHCCN